MRTLSSTLEAAQKKADRLPYVEAQVYDFEQGIKRLSWTRLYEGTEPDNHHGIAFDGQGAMHRIRTEGNNLYYQKLPSPFNAPPSFPLSFPISLVSWFDEWDLVASDCDGPCAIGAYVAKVYIFYRKTDNTLRKYYSHNYGESWTDAQLISYADVLSLAACWWGTGDIVVCFALKASQLNGIVLDSSDQSTTQHTWSDATHPLLATYGIGATFNSFWPCCEIVFAGKEDDSPYNHFDLFRTWFSDTYNFLALESFLMAPEGEDITYEYPDCHLPSSAQPCETNRIIAVEKFVGVTAYTRPLTSHMVKGTYWSDTTFTEPKPFLKSSHSEQSEESQYGLRLQSTTDYWWLEKPDGVWRAPRVAGNPLVLSSDAVSGKILSLTQGISSPLTGEGQGEGALTITLDNSGGQYANPGTGSLAALKKGSEVVLKLGYKSSQGNESSEAGTYWIDSWEYSSSLSPGGRGLGRGGEGVSVFRLYCLGGWGLADRWSARYQMRWNKDQVNPRSVWQILYQLLARVGVRLTNSPPKPQSSAINNLYPDFTVQPGTGGDAAIRRLLSFVPDRLVFRGQEAFTKDPRADEPSCYSCKFPSPSKGEGQGEGAIHTILSGEYRELTHASRACAIGRDASDNRIVEEALDWDLLSLAIDILKQDYDPNLENATRTQERADAILRGESLRAQRGNLVVPTNCGQELLDVITVTDERCGISEENYRILAIQTEYDRSKAIYTQRLSVCAP